MEVVNTGTYPYSSICYLKPDFPGAPSSDRGRHRGTGCLVASRIILTAGHNIHDPDYGEAQSIRIAIGDNVITLNKDSRPKPYRPSSNWRTSLSRGFSPNDYGFIFLPPDKPYGNWLGAFTLDSRKVSVNQDKNVIVAGFSSNDPSERLWKGNGRLLASGDPVYKLRYNVDTTGGISGGPVFYQDGASANLIGIHNGYWDTDDTQGRGLKLSANIHDQIEVLNGAMI